MLWVRLASVTHDLCSQATGLRHRATPNERGWESSQAVHLGGNAKGLLTSHPVSARYKHCFFSLTRAGHKPDLWLDE